MYDRVSLRSGYFMYPFEMCGRESAVLPYRDPYRDPNLSPDVSALTAPKKFAASGLSVGKQAAIMPTFISILDDMSLAIVWTGFKSSLLLPDVVPCASAGEIGLFKEMVLQGYLVNRGATGALSCQINDLH